MSKFVAFFVSLSLFSAPAAFAQSETDQQSQPQTEDQAKKEETFKKLLNEAGIEAFRSLKKANKECIKTAVAGKSIAMLIPSAASTFVGSYFGLRDELKGSQKFVDSIVKSDMHSTNKIYELGKAGKTTEQATRFPRGRLSKWLSRTGLALFLAYGVEQTYYWTTGKDLFTASSMNEFVQWLRSKSTGAMSGEELADYYTTAAGFQQFLGLNDEDDVKMLMERNPILVAGTIAIAQLVQVTGCTPIKYIGPQSLDEDSKKMLTKPTKAKGEAL